MLECENWPYSPLLCWNVGMWELTLFSYLENIGMWELTLCLLELTLFSYWNVRTDPVLLALCSENVGMWELTLFCYLFWKCWNVRTDPLLAILCVCRKCWNVRTDPILPTLFSLLRRKCWNVRTDPILLLSILPENVGMWELTLFSFPWKMLECENWPYSPPILECENWPYSPILNNQ